jgi:hypothetical protein
VRAPGAWSMLSRPPRAVLSPGVAIHRRESHAESDRVDIRDNDLGRIRRRNL